MNIQEFIPRYKQIKSEGFIEITRKGDGKYGNTFEDLLGLVENNLKTPDIDGFEIKDSTDFSLFLLEKAHVATVTGEAFGSPKNIRISYAASRENIKKAVSRIKNIF